jgi:23S rRNA (cytosine1962-C5)-methyltransferase
VRFIVDDCLKFVQKELRRGNKYDCIIMDPPSYGRGPNGEVWKFEKNINYLVEETAKILSDKPLFFLINSYTTGISEIVLENILKLKFKNIEGKIEAGQIGLPIKENGLILPCGIYGKFETD